MKLLGFLHNRRDKKDTLYSKKDNLLQSQAEEDEIMDEIRREYFPRFDEPLTNYVIDPRLFPVYELVQEAFEIDPAIPMPNAALLKATRRPEIPNVIKTFVCKPTKSGKEPKYVAELVFGLYGTMRKNQLGMWYGGENGSHGEIWYLKNLIPGKVRVDIWEDKTHWSIRGKIIDGSLHLAYVERCYPNELSKRIYDYRKSIDARAML